MSDVTSSGEIFEFSPENKTWARLKPEGEKLPEIDSFGCVYVGGKEEEKIVIICGYDGKKADYLNSVYEYNITKNKLSILFQGASAKTGTNLVTQARHLRPGAAARRPPTARACTFSGARTPRTG